MESQPIITESVVELANSVMESADSTADFCQDLARIGVWVWAKARTDWTDFPSRRPTPVETVY